jgi:hypothetical protein
MPAASRKACPASIQGCELGSLFHKSAELEVGELLLNGPLLWGGHSCLRPAFEPVWLREGGMRGLPQEAEFSWAEGPPHGKATLCLDTKAPASG